MQFALDCKSALWVKDLSETSDSGCILFLFFTFSLSVVRVTCVDSSRLRMLNQLLCGRLLLLFNVLSLFAPEFGTCVYQGSCLLQVMLTHCKVI